MKIYTDTERLDAFIAYSRCFRYSEMPSMDGRWPAWICWTPSKGSKVYKNLRDAIDDLITDIKNTNDKQAN
jgi:hypothetical protein